MSGEIKDLVEVYPVRLSIEESDGGRIKIKGPFGHCRQPTANKRLYSEKVMRPNIERLSEAMSHRRVFGELDHPKDGHTSLKRVSHIVTHLEITQDGQVVGEIEPLPTPMGDILVALAKANCELGVSSRGSGSTVNNNGIDEVQADYMLKTYDIVDNPASKNAFPSIIRENDMESGIESFLESIDQKHRDDVRKVMVDSVAKAKTFTIEDIKDEDLRGLVAEAIGVKEEVTPQDTEKKQVASTKLSEELRAEFNEKLESMRESLQDEALKQARIEILSSKEELFARNVLATLSEAMQPFFASDSAEIAKLKMENIALSDYVKDIEFKLSNALFEERKREEALKERELGVYLHSKVSSHPMSEEIIKAFGGIKGLTTEDIDRRVESLFVGFGQPGKAGAVIANDLKDKIEKLEAMLATTKSQSDEEIDGLKRQLEGRQEKEEEMVRKLAKAARKAKEEAERHHDEFKESVEESERVFAQLESKVLELEEQLELANVRCTLAEGLFGRDDALSVYMRASGIKTMEEATQYLEENRQVKSKGNLRERTRRGLGYSESESVLTENRQKQRDGDIVLETGERINLDDISRLAGIKER